MGDSILTRRFDSVIEIDTEVVYQANGTYSYVIPSGVTLISAVAVGGGGCGDDANANGVDGGGSGGGGGALVYANNISVTENQTITIVVGKGGQSGGGRPGRAESGGLSRITVGSFVMTANGGTGGVGYPADLDGTLGGTFTFSNTPSGVTTGGGNGGLGGFAWNGGGGGGGAGGFNGAGGNGMASRSDQGGPQSGQNGVGTGSGGGGQAGRPAGIGNGGGGNGGSGEFDRTGGGGGGVNVFGPGFTAQNGANGNNRTSLSPQSKGGFGGYPGGGGGGAYESQNVSNLAAPSPGANGIVYILLDGRTFPLN